MNHNPRKFEEKIALNKQKQEEQNKQFEDIIRDVNSIRDQESNHNFRSLPNINGPQHAGYPYTNFSFGVINQHEPMWTTGDIHHGLSLQLPESQQGRRVLSDSQLHKPNLRAGDGDDWSHHIMSKLQRPKSASELMSYDNSISAKTGSLPDLTQNYIPVQDESYNQNILHYQDSSRGAHRGGQMQVGHPGHYYMSIDEATATDLQHRQQQQQQHTRQYSPVPSPPGTPQNMYTYNFGSPNQNYQRMTAQMQEFHLHNSPTSIHSGNGSPVPPSSQPSSRTESQVKPLYSEESLSPQHQYVYYQNSPQALPPAKYSNPPSIPKIQVYTPEQQLSPQYYPVDEDMTTMIGDMSDFMLDFDASLLDQQFNTDEVQGTLESIFPSSSGTCQNYPYS